MAEPLQQFSLKSIPIIDPNGQFGTIDKAEAAEALKNGFRLPSEQELKDFQLKQEYGTGFGNELKAFAESAASTATFGLSRALEREMGVDPEAMAAREKYNPGASGLGTAAGIVVPLLAPEFSGPAALLNPVQAVSKGARAVTRAALPAAEEAAALAVNPETRAVAHRVLSQGLAGATGSAVEGAAYGLGQSVDEAALGDPDLNAEKVLANIGFGAAFGGALGGLVEGALAPFQKSALMHAADRIEARTAAELPQAQFAREAATDNFEASVAASMLPEAEKKSIFDGIKKLKDNVDEVDAASNELGVQAFPAQRSASDAVQNRWGMTVDSPSVFGAAEKARVDEAALQVSKRVDEALGTSEAVSTADFGSNMKSGFFEELEKRANALSEKFEAGKGLREAIPISEKSAQSVARNMVKLEGFTTSGGKAFESSSAYQFAKRMASEMENIRTLEDLKKFRTIIRQESAGNPELRYVAGQIQEKLGNLEHRTRKRFITEKLKTGVAREKVAAELAEYTATRAEYATMMRQFEQLAEISGKRKVYGPRDMLDFIEDIRSEKLANKLSSMARDNASGNAAGLAFIKEQFPAQFEALRNQIKAEIRSEALKDGVLNVNKALKEIEKLSPEARALLFGEKEIKTLKAAKTWHESWPKKWGPSGTPQGIQYLDFFKNPLSAISMTARDAVGLKFAYAMAGGGENAAKIAGLASIERAAQATARALQRGSREIFSDKPLHAITGAASLTRRESDKKKKSEQVKKEIKEAAANPELLMDKLDKATAKLFPIAPNHSSGVQMGIIRGAQFLHSKLPKEPDLKPLSPKHVPNQTEVSRFNRYHAIVENPIRALEQVKAGTITHETIETLTTVYPKLYAEMKTTMLDRLTDHVAKSGKPLPYKVKLGLSLFLGTDLDHSMSPQAIMANQQALAAPGSQQKDNQPLRVSQKGLSAITKSERLMTPFGGSDSETS